ncbi:MAG: APC family permease [Candidatus Eremiobacteraeota bacterium]|nr:APC family permease [Candidatus Eremiobacteraeota bacterium]
MQRLRSGSLTFIEVLAASLALIGLTMTPVLIAPNMYASAGNGSWLAYVLGGLMLVFVAFNLNAFTKRSSAVGSMFGYAAQNLGPVGGAVAGWCMIWAYVFVGAAVLGALALFTQQIAGLFGGAVWAPVPMFAVAAFCFYLSYSGVQISTIIMLTLEVVSVAMICVIVTAIFLRHGLAPDPDQVHLAGAHAKDIGLGIASVAVFSLVGFESATAFGEEARNPLIVIPRAVLSSVIIATLFFVVVVYAEVLGLRGTGTTLDKLAAPLGTLAENLHIGYLKLPILIGACFSAFSVALACVSTSARIIVAMGRSEIFPPAATAVDPRHETPHVALGVSALAMLLVAYAMLALHWAPVDIFNYAGTLSAFAFIVIYAMIALAAPAYLRRIGECRPADVLVSAVAIAFLF